MVILDMNYLNSFLIMILALMASCSPPAPSNSYVGKTLEYQYGKDIYHVTFDSDSTLRWEVLGGDELGEKEKENYRAEWIDSQHLFITWGEANGIGVSQVLDFENGEVFNHLLRGRNVSVGKGKIRWLE